MLQYQTVEPATLELLKSLMSKDYLTPFNLVGGTALALQIGHRMSVDLDLFTPDIEFDDTELLDNLSNDFQDFSVRYRRPNAIIMMIQNVKVDFIRFKYPFFKPLHHFDGIRMVDAEDIATMKIDAITGRGKKKDFVDLYYLLQRYDLPHILELYQKKYKHVTLFHVIKSLTYFEDAEADEVEMLDDKVTWAMMKKTIQMAVNQIE